MSWQVRLDGGLQRWHWSTCAQASGSSAPSRAARAPPRFVLTTSELTAPAEG